MVPKDKSVSELPNSAHTGPHNLAYVLMNSNEFTITKEAMNVESNSEARSRKHFCCGKQPVIRNPKVCVSNLRYSA
jgi:hypothetical protein